MPSTKGEKGLTLSGKELPARDGKPAMLRPGSGVQSDAAGRFFIAAAEGRPVYCGGIISVSPVYEV
ncbi:MAG: FapA family protein, partial [Planctomycetota bacterium]|nr:FapA family protein [Planctomycetota bacterium]